jgi:drug/metabolite transporter (DMT)-like permease
MAFGAAFGSSVCYGSAYLLQQSGVRQEHVVTALDPRLLLRLSRQPAYVGGIALDLVGWALSLVALRTLPLFMVQVVVGTSVAVAAVLDVVVSGVPLTLTERMGAGAVVLGLGGVAAAAAPDGPGRITSAGQLIVGLGLAAVIGLAIAAARTRGPRSAIFLAAVAGLAYGGTAMAARVVRVPPRPLGLFGEPLAWALGIYGLIGALTLALALQRGSVISVSAAVFVAETSVPALLGIAFFGDRTRVGLGLLAVAGFLLSFLGVYLLVRETLSRRHESFL